MAKYGKGRFNIVPMPASRAPEITEGDIARRACELYQSRSGTAGHELEEWLAAERELRQAVSGRRPAGQD
jgi:hypothetical protein